MKSIRNPRFFALIGIFLLAVLLRVATLSSALLGNAAWVNFNEVLSRDSPPDAAMQSAATQFQKAQLADTANRSVWLGEGLAHALRGDIVAAHAAWAEGKVDPKVLTQYGTKARQDGRIDAAITIFRGAAALRNDVDAQELFLAGSVCQQTFAAPTLLNDDNAQFCAALLNEDNNNLLLNGYANTGSLYGWQGKYFFLDPEKALATIEYSEGANGPVFKLVGYSAGDHFGLFQRISLPAGAKVRFSGRFKVETRENLEARLLYIAWRGSDGRPEGNQSAWQTTDLEWTSFERVFVVPESEGSLLAFYPAVFSGKGTIWFDELRLEIVTD